MYSSVTSVALVGVQAQPVRVEVHVSGSKESFRIVGLPDASVREAKDRVKAAMLVSGLGWPPGRVTVNLAPADVPKAGSAYDLPIALALVRAWRRDLTVGRCVALGELTLQGELRPVRGGLGAALVAKKERLPVYLAPRAAGDATLIDEVDLRPVRSLLEAIDVDRGLSDPVPAKVATSYPTSWQLDMEAVRGQVHARRAIELAAAGGHHVLLSGPPGIGKSMLAKAFPGVLPDLTEDSALQVAQVYAAAGRRRPPWKRPPIRRPHHSATPAALVGGGSGVPVPGEISLAHKGVLFLDELGEFPTHTLNMLRQPLEDEVVTIARKGATVEFPAQMQMIAATNPCPCGYAGDRTQACICPPSLVSSYRRRISGPLLDRFDLRVAMPRPTWDELGSVGESSQSVRGRVERARARQQLRGCLNRSLPASSLERQDWDDQARSLLESASRQLTARGHDRVRRVARTIADLDEQESITGEHVAEALSYRTQP